MAKLVEIVPVSLESNDSKNEARRRLEILLNQGWEIASCGGGTGLLHRDIAGFVILVKEHTK